MGRDKARLRLGRRTMLSIVRATARELGQPVRVIRRDLVPRCGPLGGVLTALQTTRADAVLLLACDMPFVTAPLLRKIIRASRQGGRAVFAEQRGRVGFPFLLSRSAAAEVRAALARHEFSVNALASRLRARKVSVRARCLDLFNVNTPDEARVAVECHRGRFSFSK